MNSAAFLPRIGSRPIANQPNILLLITDQQRYPRHWPEDPAWLRDLTPNDAELSRTGLSFRRGFCNTSMCSPSRATLFTGVYPAKHGVTLTHTAADLQPDPRHAPFVFLKMANLMRQPGTPKKRLADGFARGLLRLGAPSGNEPELPTNIPNLATVLRGAGYEVAYRGKWHLTHPGGGEWSERDSERLEREYGFAGWVPPDAGENAKAENFGGGNAGPLGTGWDEVYTRQVEEFLDQADLPEPFCLVVSLVNPHDVLGYPASYERGGYSTEEFRDLGVELPPSVDEDLSGKPSVQTLIQMGMTAYLGPLRGRQAQLDYVNFYAHLHRVIDEKIGRVLGALGDAEDLGSLRSRTVVMRVSDHGEMGLSHGGLRQKAFNAYEETVRVPIVISNPQLFPEPAETDAFAGLIDVVPTLASFAGAVLDGELDGRDLSPIAAKHAGKHEWLRGVEPADSVQDGIHFTYDDHQAGTARKNVPGQPNRVRAVRDERWKYALYFDPAGNATSEYELYDLDRDPDEVRNLVNFRTGEALEPADRAALDQMRERLYATMSEHGTGPTT
ncbi:MAG: sulfatase-like hydrolase/transferase [Solirubrobacterales bacterium]